MPAVITMIASITQLLPTASSYATASSGRARYQRLKPSRPAKASTLP